MAPYRGRLAPSPTGLLHLGHARTFWIAQQRSLQHHGILILRNEDLDRARCKTEFVSAMFEDLHWFGFRWQEGPDVGGPCASYTQSDRGALYRAAFNQLFRRGCLYPCTCSRKDILHALSAPHAADHEPVYPGTCRNRPSPEPATPSSKLETTSASLSTSSLPSLVRALSALDSGLEPPLSAKLNWRFQVSDGETIEFVDGYFGPQSFVAGRDFGDFVVWRHDDLAAYQLAAVVDDAAMGITEVVRGADLLVSTARQILLYRALNLTPPTFFHCPLLTDSQGVRLAKRHDALSLRALRTQGAQPASLRAGW